MSRGAVPRLDVLLAPPDLGGRVGPPVTSLAGHLRARKRLRDACRAGGRVVGVAAPAGLPVPQSLQGAPLRGPPAHRLHVELRVLLRLSDRARGSQPGGLPDGRDATLDLSDDVRDGITGAVHEITDALESDLQTLEQSP